MISNVVMMGMGEPLQNYDRLVPALRTMLDDHGYGLSRRRVTVSTSGVVPMIERLAQDCPVALAVSLHAPTDELREHLVPLNRKYPMDELLRTCTAYLAHAPRDFITFEYCMLDGVNDQPEHAEALIALVRQHGADALTAGYQVFTTLDGRLQQAANAATWRTILEYERRHGYRGPLERLDPAQLGGADTLNQVFKRIPPRGSLRPAVVTAVAERSAEVRLRDGTAATLDWDGLSWARPVIDALKDAMGPNPKTAGDVLAVGDVVYADLDEKQYR